MIIISLVYLNELLENNIPSNQNDLKRRIGSRKESRLRKKKKEKPRTSLNLEARAKDESRNYSRS